MGARQHSKPVARDDLLAEAAERSAQLAAQLRADASSLRAPDLAKAAEALRQCAIAADRLAQALREQDPKGS